MLTQRDFAVKWSVYALFALLFTFLCSFTLSRITLLRVIPFLPPVLLAVICSFEPNLQGVIFGIVYGVLCDLALPGAFPFLYTLTFAISAAVILVLSNSVLQPGFFRALCCTLVAFLIVDLFAGAAVLIAGRASFAAVVLLFARETLVSLILLPPCALVFFFVHRLFTV